MMRRLAVRHEGALPLAAVEHIWREIVTTFTAVQAPFGVAVAPADGPLAMRDLVRFYFGFSAALTDFETGAAAIDRVRSGGAIAVVPAGLREQWWGSFEGEDAPRIFAKLPFIELADHPPYLPAYVIGPPLKQRFVPDIEVYALARDPKLEPAVTALGGHVIAAEEHALIELPVAATLADIEAQLGSPLRDVRLLGGFCQPIRVLAERTA